MKKETSCGCIIIDNDKVLLVFEEGRNFWGFPKGHMEEGETELETALREVKEEVGLDVTIDTSKRYILNYNINNKIDKTTILYLAKPLTSNVKKQDSEIKDAKWVSLDQVVDTLTFDNWKEMFKEVLIDLKK
jgi:8-oxo-dGTP pyrophosphatase MutT (NUDIX family)